MRPAAPGRAPRAAPLLALALALGLAACGSGEGRLTVLAAASLADALPRVDDGPRYSFAASGTLAAQVRQGAPADVVVVADARLAARLHADGLVERPRAVAETRLVILVPRGNPAGVRAVEDLRRPGIRFVMADAGVPAGDYAREALRRLGAADLVARAAGLVEDARGVAGRLALGEADAGFAYATDAAAAGAEIVELPPGAAPPVRYRAAVVADSSRRQEARAFLARLVAPEGRAILRAAGFAPP